jgi:hypothetical protein
MPISFRSCSVNVANVARSTSWRKKTSVYFARPWKIQLSSRKKFSSIDAVIFKFFWGGTWGCEKIWEGVLYFCVLLHFYIKIFQVFWGGTRGTPLPCVFEQFFGIIPRLFICIRLAVNNLNDAIVTTCILLAKTIFRCQLS